MATRLAVIVATAMRFFEYLPEQQYPAPDAESLFVRNPALAECTVWHNGAL